MFSPSAVSASSTSLTKTDYLLAGGLTLATVIYVIGHIHHPILPMEDASMLLRYSQNVARGNGIVWNVGEHPVEGATDFLFMLLIGAVSGITKIGVKTVAAGILLVSHAASVATLYLVLRKLYRAPVMVAGGFAAILGAGLGYHFVDMAFSAPFYGFFALLTWVVGMVCVQQGVTWQRAIWFALLGFTTGLIRPDGVILALLMLGSVVYGVRSGWADRSKLIIAVGIIFAVFGGAYFGWRLHYFGYPFPNPFYIKHSSALQLSGMKRSFRNVVEMLMPLLPLVALGLRNRAARQQTIAWLLTMVPFTTVWMFISADNNHYSRFQYVMIPFSLLVLGGLVAGWWNEQAEGSDGAARVRSMALPVGGVFAVLVLLTIYYNARLYLAPFSNYGAQNLAQRLKPYASKNYTMVVTEAGDLPLYSKWRAIDAVGLNDAYIAHHEHYPTTAYLDQYKPEILQYRVWGDYVSNAEYLAQLGGPPVETKDVLTLVDMALARYAKEHGYVLAAVWGTDRCIADVYWVRSDFADRDAILSDIRDHTYYAQESGKLTTDFRNIPPPTAVCQAR